MNIVNFLNLNFFISLVFFTKFIIFKELFKFVLRPILYNLLNQATKP